MSERKFELLKDTLDSKGVICRAGEILHLDCNGTVYCNYCEPNKGHLFYDVQHVESNKEWFKEITEEKTLEEEIYNGIRDRCIGDGKEASKRIFDFIKTKFPHLFEKPQVETKEKSIEEIFKEEKKKRENLSDGNFVRGFNHGLNKSLKIIAKNGYKIVKEDK